MSNLGLIEAPFLCIPPGNLQSFALDQAETRRRSDRLRNVWRTIAIICTFRRGSFEGRLLYSCSRMPSWSDRAQRLKVDLTANEYSSSLAGMLTNAVIV